MFVQKEIVMPRDVGAYLAEQQRKSSGEVATEWGQLEEFYNKKYETPFKSVWIKQEYV